MNLGSRLVVTGRAAAALAVLAAAGCSRGAGPSDAEPAYADPARGRHLVFAHGCGSCHVIPGVSGANGVIGPSLAGLARRSFIAGSFVNERERLEMWIVQPQQLQPGSAMPAVGVTPAQARHIAAYLYTLR